MFSFFARKPKPAEDPLRDLQHREDSGTQPRTPSPPTASAPGGNRRARALGSPRVFPGPVATADAPSPAPTAETLHALVASVPPKTLHEYTLARLLPSSSSHPGDEPPPLDPSTLRRLSHFFAALSPPPMLHCVRCHKPFFAVENTDRACLVPHDDDSAQVERAGGGYETLWGCCARTVEGAGDMGPPDGWCYEGMHTTDPKRARFRADSSLHDDKLVPCARLRCLDPPAPSPLSSPASSPPASPKRRRAANAKKRRISMVDGASAEDAQQDRAEGEGMDVDDAKTAAGSVSSPGKRRKTNTAASSGTRGTKKKHVQNAAPLPSSTAADAGDIDMTDAPAPHAPESISNPGGTPSPSSKHKISASTSTSRPTKPRKKRARPRGSDDDAVFKPSPHPVSPSDDEVSVSDASTGKKTGKAGTRPRKSNASSQGARTGKAKEGEGTPSAPGTPSNANGGPKNPAPPAHVHRASFLPLPEGTGTDPVRAAAKARKAQARVRARALEEVVGTSVEGEAGFGPARPGTGR